MEVRFKRPLQPLALLLAAIALAIAPSGLARGQSYGIELHNAMMPASGGMAGLSMSRPQDLQSAINGNPATLTQFKGTQFSFGGAYIEATYNVNQQASLPLFGVEPFSAKSGTPGTIAGNIGLTQDLSAFGLPATVGLGFVSNAGAGAEFRRVPESNGTSSHYIAFDTVSSLGVDITDRLSVGGALFIGTGLLDGPFVDFGSLVPDYALRGSVGLNYKLTSATWLGGKWQTKKSHTFDDAALILNLPAQDIVLEHPDNFAFGITNSSLLDGRLLIGADIIWKRYSDAEFVKAIYDDQLAYVFGSQLQVGEHLALRMGYGYNDNPMAGAQRTSIGGVALPDGVPGLRYVQGQFAAITQHRLTGGIGVSDVLPGVDMDFFAGGAFRNTDQFAATEVSVVGWWTGFGLTWRFGRGSCEDLCIPDQW